MTNQQPRDVLEEATRLLLNANVPPVYFRYDARLVTIESEALEIRRVSAAAMYRRLISLANWVRIGRYGPVASAPPGTIVKALIEAPDERFPELDAIARVPAFDGDFRLLLDRGYHPSARVYVASDFAGDAQKSSPSQSEARALIDEALCDFPFTTESSRAHAIALLLLPFVRLALAGNPTPLHMIESPTPGSGKGRLADLVSTIVRGEPCRPTSLSSSKSENAKKLTGLLAAGTEFILLDNLPQERVMDDPVLAGMLTTTSPAERQLGRNTILRLKNHAVWIGTANNPRTSPELSRRSVRIRLDPACDRPWLRKGFRHPNLLAWARERRHDLVASCLTLVQAWVDAGRPNKNDQILGSYEAWSAVLGGILDHAGIPGFLDDLDAMYATYDEESREWRVLLEAWWERHEAHPLTATVVNELCQARGLLEDVRGFGGQRSQVSRLGRALQQNADRVFGNYRLLCDTTAVRSSARYRVEPVDMDTKQVYTT